MQGIKKDYESDITHHKDELIHQVFYLIIVLILFRNKVN